MPKLNNAWHDKRSSISTYETYSKHGRHLCQENCQAFIVFNFANVRNPRHESSLAEVGTVLWPYVFHIQSAQHRNSNFKASTEWTALRLNCGLSKHTSVPPPRSATPGPPQYAAGSSPPRPAPRLSPAGTLRSPRRSPAALLAVAGGRNLNVLLSLDAIMALAGSLGYQWVKVQRKK